MPALNELQIIHTLSQKLGASFDASDDAFFDPQTRQILTTDLLIEGNHFSLDYSGFSDIGYKAIAVNASDVAAMGGLPVYYLISLGVPQAALESQITQLYEGLKQACDEMGGAIVGGDTVSSPQWTINVTAIGKLPEGHHVGLRSQAKPGDVVVTTGFHGLSRAGLDLLKTGQSQVAYPTLLSAHRRPKANIRAGQILSGRYERYALMDSSDGLADALLKIAAASGVSIEIDQTLVPVHPELKAYREQCSQAVWDWVLYGGEDFELVATLPEWHSNLSELFTVIGRVLPLESGSPQVWVTSETTPEKEFLSFEGCYQHFES